MKKTATLLSLSFTDRGSVISEPKQQNGTAGSIVMLPAVPFFCQDSFYLIRLSRMPIALLDWLTPMLCTRMTSETPYCSASLLTVV